MKSVFPRQTRLLLSVFFISIFYLQSGFSQRASWQDLRAQGANYYEIKKAFLKKNAGKLKEFKREIKKETPLGKVRRAEASEKDVEEILQFMRWSQFYEPRAAEFGGDIAAMHGAHSLAAEQRAQKLKTRRSSSDNTGTWASVGPNTTPMYGGNGRVNSVRVHPAYPNIMFASAPSGGLWKTTNSGQSWIPIANNIPVLGCSDLAFDPADPNIMYLATGDHDNGDAPSTGVYKSTDGGATWNATGLIFPFANFFEPGGILVHPGKPNIVIFSATAGVFRSTDGGATWARTSAIGMKDIHFKVGDPNILFGTNGSKFYQSTDNGVTWQNKAGNNGLPTNAQRMSIGLTDADPSYIYVLAANNTNFGFKGLYLSTDGGVTFKLASSSPNLLGYNFDGKDKGGQGWYTLSIAVSPLNKNVVYTGGVNIWKSKDGGSTWEIQTHWYGDQGLPYVHADIHEIKINGTDIFVSCDGGVFKSDLINGDWTDLSSNLGIAEIYSIGLSSTDPNLMISGHQDNGTNVTWDKYSFINETGGDGMQCFIDRTTNNVLYGEYYYGQFFKSVDNGHNFDYIGKGFDNTNASWVTPWLQDPADAATIYAGSDEVYKSVDGGANFVPISSFGTTDNLYALEVALSNSKIIYAGSFNNLYKSTNGGASWTDVSKGLPVITNQITSVKVDPNNTNAVFVSFISYNAGRQIYKTQDGGATWTRFNPGLPLIPVMSLVFDKNSTHQAVYAGNDLGIYYWDNTLDHWTYFSDGMPGVPVYDLQIFYGDQKKIRAGTYGRGIYESDLFISTAPTAPTVNITAPADNSVFTTPVDVNITAGASQVNGSISRVEFYDGLALLGTSVSAPFNFLWGNVPAGNHTLTAKALGADNQSASSTPVHVLVNNGPVLTPQAAILTPANNAIFTAPASIFLTSSASETGGVISRVEYYNGQNILGISSLAPYSLTWNNVSAGAYTFTALAYDASGRFAVSAPVNILINNKPIAPFSEGGQASPIIKSANEYDNLNFFVYPNPTDEAVTMQIQAPESGGYKLTVLNVLGIAMQSEQLTLSAGDNLVPLKLKGYAPDFYFIQLENHAQRVTRKLTIK